MQTYGKPALERPPEGTPELSMAVTSDDINTVVFLALCDNDGRIDELAIGRANRNPKDAAQPIAGLRIAFKRALEEIFCIGSHDGKKIISKAGRAIWHQFRVENPLPPVINNAPRGKLQVQHIADVPARQNDGPVISSSVERKE